TIQLPPAYYLESLPKNRTVQSRWGTFTAKISTPDKGEAIRRLEVVFHTRLDKSLVEPADFDEFRKFQEDVSRDYRVWLTLKPARALAGAPLREALLALAPEDSASAMVLAELYLQHNKPKDARRVLQRARAYGDDAELWELSVKAAAGPEEEEKAYRELMRRFPDEPRHIVALAASLIGRDPHDEARLRLGPLTKAAAPAFQAQAHYQLARSHYRRDELPKALQHLHDAAKANPDGVNTVRAHCLLGHILEELGKPVEAAKAYQQALVVDHD